jgi:outer membrane lipoprotein-sorting protein
MAEKLTKAKTYTFEFAFEIVEDKEKEFDHRGSVAVAPNNRIKLTMKGVTRAQPISAVIVCDGKTLVEHLEMAAGAYPMASDGTTTAAFGVWFVRMGVFECLDNVLDRGKPRDFGKIMLSDFKTVGKEVVAGRGTTIIQLKIEAPYYPKDATCKLWLDNETNVPLKRVVEGDGGKLRHMETYANWNFDPKLPDDTFTIPK